MIARCCAVRSIPGAGSNKDDEEMVRTLVTYLAQKIRRERSGILEGLSQE